jgi:hypothetical protein
MIATKSVELRAKTYQKTIVETSEIDSPASVSSYVARILALYCSLPPVRYRFPTADDIRLARALEGASVPLAVVEVALFRGALIRIKLDWQQGRMERLRSIARLSHFLPLIRKARRFDCSEETARSLARQLHLLDVEWTDPGSSLPGSNFN